MVTLLAERKGAWDQWMYQLLVARYTLGIGDELPPLRHQLLPRSHYLNLHNFVELHALRPEEVRSAVAVHCGYVNDGAGAKLEQLGKNGLLAPGLSMHSVLASYVTAPPGR